MFSGIVEYLGSVKSCLNDNNYVFRNGKGVIYNKSKRLLQVYLLYKFLHPYKVPKAIYTD